MKNSEIFIDVTIVIVMKYRRLYAIRSFYGYLMERKLSHGSPVSLKRVSNVFGHCVP
jgi:hypothetical protein